MAYQVKEEEEEQEIITVVIKEDINDLCRFCSKNLRVHGILGNSVLLFQPAPARKLETLSILQRLAGLGLTLIPNKNKSKRMCTTCYKLINRLERDLAVFRKWQQGEDKTPIDKTSSQATSESSESTDNRKRPTPPEIPTAPKKMRRVHPPAQSGERRSITQVITEYPSKTVVTVSSQSEAGIIQHINKRNWKTAANLISIHKDLFEQLKLRILSAISEDSQRITNPNNKFMLWKSTPEDLKSFSLDKLILGFEEASPFLLSIFKSVSKENLPAACTALCIALRGREPRMSAFAYYINDILQRAGTRKAAFNKLNKMSITTSYERANKRQKELAATCGKKKKEANVSTELFLTDESGKCDNNMEDITLSEEYTEDNESEDLAGLHFSQITDSDAEDVPDQCCLPNSQNDCPQTE